VKIDQCLSLRNALVCPHGLRSALSEDTLETRWKRRTSRTRATCRRALLGRRSAAVCRSCLPDNASSAPPRSRPLTRTHASHHHGLLVRRPLPHPRRALTPPRAQEPREQQPAGRARRRRGCGRTWRTWRRAEALADADERDLPRRRAYPSLARRRHPLGRGERAGRGRAAAVPVRAVRGRGARQGQLQDDRHAPEVRGRDGVGREERCVRDRPARGVARGLTRAGGGRAVFDFYQNLNLFYGIISECCTPQSCPTMAAGPQCVSAADRLWGAR
jgi:hypothetical protein